MDNDSETFALGGGFKVMSRSWIFYVGRRRALFNKEANDRTADNADEFLTKLCPFQV